MQVSAGGAGKAGIALLGTGRRNGRTRCGILVTLRDDSLGLGGVAYAAAVSLHTVSSTGRRGRYIPRAPGVSLGRCIRADHLVAAACAGVAGIALLGAGRVNGFACVAVSECV